MYSPTPTFSLLPAISGIMTSVTALVASKVKCHCILPCLTDGVKMLSIYLSDGSNGRPRLRDGGPRNPLPDLPLESSTRALRPHIVRPSNPRTASSASRASSNSTNAKLIVGKSLSAQSKALHLCLCLLSKLTRADYELSIHCVVAHNS